MRSRNSISIARLSNPSLMVGGTPPVFPPARYSLVFTCARTMLLTSRKIDPLGYEPFLRLVTSPVYFQTPRSKMFCTSSMLLEAGSTVSQVTDGSRAATQPSHSIHFQ